MAARGDRRWLLGLAALLLTSEVVLAAPDDRDSALRSLLRCQQISAHRDGDGEVRSLIVWLMPRADLTVLSSLPQLEALTVYGGASDADMLAIACCTHLRGLDLHDSPNVTDVGVAAIGLLRSLEALMLSGTGLGDAGASSLAGLENLRTLDLSNTAVGDAGLEGLASLPALEVVNLSRTRVRDPGLAFVGRWATLRKLDLSYNAIDGRGFDALRELTNLTSLDLIGCDVRDEGLARLTPLRGLTSLRLSGNAKLSDHGLAMLTSFPFLRGLDLAGTGITSAGLAAIGGCEFVTSVNLISTAVDDSAIATLVALPDLRFAYLEDAQVSFEGIQQLARDAPRLEHMEPHSNWNDAQIQAFAREFPRLVRSRCGFASGTPWHERLNRERKAAAFRSPMTLAVERGDLAEVELQLAAGAPAEWRMFTGGYDSKGTSLLLRSIELRHSAIARLLIRSGADVDVTRDDGCTPLHLAVAESDLEVVDELLRRDVNVDAADRFGRTALDAATWAENRSVVERLLARGADPLRITAKEDCPLAIAIEQDSLEIAKSMVASTTPPEAARSLRRLIFRAIDCGSKEMLQRVARVLGSFAPIEATLDTSLLSRAIKKKSDRAVLELLLSQGADPNRSQVTWNRPLWEAIDADSSMAIEVLLAHGADRELRDDDRNTALEYAQRAGASAAVIALLQASPVPEGKR